MATQEQGTLAHEKRQGEKPSEPRGFGEHVRGLAGEYAHEQGWGLDEEERKKAEAGPQDTDGGADYDYGARDFGDEPINGRRIGPKPDEETARRTLGVDNKLEQQKERE